MPSERGRFASYDQVLAGARAKAESLLAPFKNDGTVEVSLYFFGDIVPQGSSWKPALRPLVEHAGVNEALGAFDKFFLPAVDPQTKGSNYTDPNTYVAASIYALVAERQGLVDPCTPATPKDGAPVMSILVLTDAGEDGGGESSPTCARDPGRCAWDAENQKRKEWLRRQDLDNALSYTHWNIGQDSVSIVGPGEAVYRVQWVTKDKGSFNLSDPALGLNQTLTDLNPRIRLVAEGAAPSEAWRTSHPELLCEAGPKRAPVATPPGSRPVDMQAEWREREGASRLKLLDGLALAHAERLVAGVGYDLHTLRLDLEGALELPIPGDASTALVLGDHALRIDRSSLCEALLDAYPGSTFRLPPDVASPSACAPPPPRPPTGYALKPVATVALAEREVVKTWAFALTGEGIKADAPATSLGVDRWWRATGGETRAILLQPSGDVPPSWKANVDLQLLRAGAPVEERFTDVGSLDGATNLAIPASGRVTIAIPGAEQRWWTLGGDFPHGASGGDLALRVCVDAQVEDARPHVVTVACDACSSLVQVRDGRSCFDVPVSVEVRPFWSWWRIALATIAAITATWLVARWVWRPRLPPKMIVGATSLQLQAASEKWGGEPGMFQAACRAAYLTAPLGTPLYVDASVYRNGAVDAVHLAARGEVCIGLRARAGGGLLLWPARLPDGAVLLVKEEGPAQVLTVPGAVPVKPSADTCIAVSGRADLALILSVREGAQVTEVLRIEGALRR